MCVRVCACICVHAQVALLQHVLRPIKTSSKMIVQVLNSIPYIMYAQNYKKVKPEKFIQYHLKF